MSSLFFLFPSGMSFGSKKLDYKKATVEDVTDVENDAAGTTLLPLLTSLTNYPKKPHSPRPVPSAARNPPTSPPKTKTQTL
jgi:hypothetical protein